MEILCIILYTFYRKFSHVHGVSLEILGAPLKFKIKLCGFEQCLAGQHEFVMTDCGLLMVYD